MLSVVMFCWDRSPRAGVLYSNFGEISWASYRAEASDVWWWKSGISCVQRSHPKGRLFTFWKYDQGRNHIQCHWRSFGNILSNWKEFQYCLLRKFLKKNWRQTRLIRIWVEQNARRCFFSILEIYYRLRYLISTTKTSKCRLQGQQFWKENLYRNIGGELREMVSFFMNKKVQQSFAISKTS